MNDMADEGGMVKVTCPVCENTVGTKEDGTKIKAHSISGERCLGSNELVTSDETAPEGLDKGDPFGALDSAQDVGMNPNDENDPETPTEPETSTQGVASSVVSEFVHVFSIRKPCPHVYEQDVAWHAANMKMVARLAQGAGLTTTHEPRHTGNEETDTHVLVAYAVTVK